MIGKIKHIRTIAAVVTGSLLMFALMRFAAIPTIAPNTSIDFGIVILSAFAAVFGPVAGLFIGFIGHTLTDLTNGLVWWTWVLPDALYGCIIGFLWKLLKIEEGQFGIKEVLLFNGVQYVSNFMVWVVIAPSLDLIIYHQETNTVYMQGLVAAGLNSAVVLVFGTALLFGYSRIRAKTGRINENNNKVQS